MLYFYRIEVSEGIDVSKTSASNEGHICHYWYFLNKGFEFQTRVLHKFQVSASWSWCHVINDIYDP